ncbi:MAG TPA: indole-3-glycerol phosphate synthase TrpC [Bacteroidales bacterium]|nr:indole-3-glycerol phosphate synthase TrpC [Bacteroidales bacterium]
MDILEIIVAAKKEEVRRRKRLFPVKELKKSAFFDCTPISFYIALKKDGPSIIGEFKRKSPSKGEINITESVGLVAAGYEKAGVSAMSILTDNDFFGGDNNDLSEVAALTGLPLLRKDFIIDEYQVVESKSIGASAILLIGSILTKSQTEHLANMAFSLGMEVLFEIHDENDLEKMSYNIRIVGVNNRNLKTFEINMENSIDLLHQLPSDCLKVAESGFQTITDVKKMHARGYDAFLIGEKFMRSVDPSKSAAEFITGLKMVMQ